MQNRKINIMVIVSAIIILLVTSSVYAINSCRKGKNCSFPGECHDYIDSNNNNLCDLGEATSDSNNNQSNNIDGGNFEKRGNMGDGFNDNNVTGSSEQSSSNQNINTFVNIQFIGLLSFLIIATILIRTKKYRGMVRILLLVISIIVLGFIAEGCVCTIGAFQNLPLKFAGILNGNYFYWSIVTLIPIIFVFISGRIFCSGVCPIGAVSEIFFKIGTKFKLNKGNPGLEKFKFLKYTKYVIMAFLVTYTSISGVVVLCSIDPFKTLFSLSGSIVSIITLVVILILSIFVSRPVCRFICPYGALLGLFNKFASLIEIKSITPELNKYTCIKCNKCVKKCPVDAIDGYVIDEMECINCKECVSACNKGSIK